MWDEANSLYVALVAGWKFEGGRDWLNSPFAFLGSFTLGTVCKRRVQA
jgi:hypothetical protein